MLTHDKLLNPIGIIYIKGEFLEKIMKVNVGLLIFKIPESVPYDSFAVFQTFWSHTLGLGEEKTKI